MIIPSQPSGVTSPSPTLKRQMPDISPLARVFHFFLASTWITLPRRAQDQDTHILVALADRPSLPPPVRLKYNGDDVYFAELTQSQLKPDGRGLGTFLWNRTVFDVYEPTIPSKEGLLEGSLLKYVDHG